MMKVRNIIIRIYLKMSSSSDMDSTIPSTFEYINGHGGFFNDDFRLFNTDNSSGELTYQLFLTPNI